MSTNTYAVVALVAERRESYDGGWVAVFEQRFKAYADKAEPSEGDFE